MDKSDALARRLMAVFLAAILLFVLPLNAADLQAQAAQIYARYIAVGQLAEVTFKFFPGVVYTARVEAVLQAIATGQPQVGDLAVAPTRVQAAPFVVRFKLDDQEAAQRLPAGSTGLAAIYTDQVKASHVIRQVVLRQTAILNYVNPF